MLDGIQHDDKQVVGYVDLTPTWRGVLPVLLEAYCKNENLELREELLRMADAADKWNAHVKENQNEVSTLGD